MDNTYTYKSIQLFDKSIQLFDKVFNYIKFMHNTYTYKSIQLFDIIKAIYRYILQKGDIRTFKAKFYYLNINV